MTTENVVSISTTETTAENTQNALVANPLDLPVAVFSDALKRRGDNRGVFINWVRSALVDNIDYGRVPTKKGLSKPSLRKPGAEKICGMLGLSALFPNLERYEDAAIHGVEIKQIIIRCELRDNNNVIMATGIGARSVIQDGGDLNKALKMAAKSAHIDATLRCAGLSEVFTQDLEDMQQQAQQQPSPTQSQQITPVKTETAIEGELVDNEQPKDYTPNISQKQVKRLFALMKQHGITSKDSFIDKMKEAYHIEHVDQLTREQYEKVCNESIPAYGKAKQNHTPTPEDLGKKHYYTNRNTNEREFVYENDDDAFDKMRDAGCFEHRKYYSKDND